MNDARLMTELAQSCRLLACHQQNPNIPDMLHDLEEDFVQKAKEIDGGKQRAADHDPLRHEGGQIRSSSAPWFS
jgi:hypothetical protein